MSVVLIPTSFNAVDFLSIFSHIFCLFLSFLWGFVTSYTLSRIYFLYTFPLPFSYNFQYLIPSFVSYPKPWNWVKCGSKLVLYYPSQYNSSWNRTSSWIPQLYYWETTSLWLVVHSIYLPSFNAPLHIALLVAFWTPMIFIIYSPTVLNVKITYMNFSMIDNLTDQEWLVFNYTHYQHKNTQQVCLTQDKLPWTLTDSTQEKRCLIFTLYYVERGINMCDRDI